MLRLSIGKGATIVSLFVGNSEFGVTTSDIAVSYYIDGALNNLPSQSSLGINVFEILLDGQPHEVDIVIPYQQYDAVTVGNILGTWLWRLQCYGGSCSVLPNPTSAKRIAIYGDSIAEGALAVPNSSGWSQILRRTYAGTKRIAQEGWGGRALWDDSGSGSGQYGFATPALLAARLQGLLFDATTQRLVIDTMGFNDWSPGFAHWNAASFGTACANLYDAIHSADASISVLAVSPIVTGNEAATNTFSQTIAQYRAAKLAATTGRSWVTYVDGLTLVSAVNISGDGIHPTTTGQAEFATNIQASIP
jgi:lysophospholipase L1-like esterase